MKRYSNPAVDLVIRAAQATGLPESRIYSSSRTPRACAARWAVWNALRIRYDWAHHEIADHFKCHRSTVSHGLKRAALRACQDPDFGNLCGSLFDAPSTKSA